MFSASTSSAEDTLPDVIVKLLASRRWRGLTPLRGQPNAGHPGETGGSAGRSAQAAEELRTAQAQVASTAAAAANARAQAGLTVSHTQAAAAEAAHTAATSALLLRSWPGAAMRGMLAVIGGPAGIAMWWAGAAATSPVRDSAQAVKSSLET
ncbi:hypothetical protein HUK64_15325 [Pseudomonas aeruginosa]|nr:hypothetical protein [Pseudomonas aeruginosa]UJB86720.1 hypothetical protein HUK64_15325 [Pseudomonas aeruginosa]